MRSPYAPFARACFALFVLQGACAHETQGVVEHLAELDAAGSGGALGGSKSAGGGGSVSVSTPFGGGNAGTSTSGGMSGSVSFSGTFGMPSAGSGGAPGAAGSAGKSNGGSGGAAGTGGGAQDPGECQTSKLTIAEATASTEESAMLGAAMASDGVATSRWSSAHAQPEWLSLELEEESRVSRIVIRWEAAFATDYRVEVSDGADGPWMPLFRDQEGDGGTDDVDDFPAQSASFVRVLGLARATVYGFSIFEVEIYGDTDEECEE